MAYAIAIYPLIGLSAGHSLTELPMFGITPCPLTLFTLGVLLWVERVPRWLLAVPIIWSLIGGSAAFLLRVPQDWPLLFGGIAVAALVVGGHRRAAAAVATGANATDRAAGGASRPAAVR
jgi:hypothetical protein